MSDTNTLRFTPTEAAFANEAPVSHTAAIRYLMREGHAEATASEIVRHCTTVAGFCDARATIEGRLATAVLADLVVLTKEAP